jgi:hypothetical protein
MPSASPRDRPSGPGADLLDPAARLVLTAARGWFDAGGDGPGPCLLFARAGLSSDGLACFAATMGLIGVAARRPVAMHAPGACVLSRDEGLLLVAIAALQDGEPWRAQRAVAEWLPAPLVPRGIGLLARFAAALGRAGLRLRGVPMDALPMLPVSQTTVSRMLH